MVFDFKKRPTLRFPDHVESANGSPHTIWVNILKPLIKIFNNFIEISSTYKNCVYLRHTI